MKLEIMAKYVVVGDVLVNGAHKYEVTHVEEVPYTDLVNINYKTMKTEKNRCMTVVSTEFLKVEQVEEVAADLVEETDDKPAVDSKAFYVNICKEEIEKLENLSAYEVDKDQKTFLKSRIENRKIELDFLETVKNE